MYNIDFREKYLRFRRCDCHVNGSNASQKHGNGYSKNAQLVEHRVRASVIKIHMDKGIK